MTFLAPSTGPVSFQGILEVLPISLDKCVTHQPGSYTRPATCAFQPVAIGAVRGGNEMD